MSSYEVFLSFRGPDTRNHFADFLYTMLKDVGICVFRDEEELLPGREIIPNLMEAIQQSKISIPVISKEYASSRSCLMELVQMVECMDNNGQTIIPIFYHVNPSDVRNCPGPSEMALDEPQKRALSRIGDLKGHHHLERSEKYHSEVIKQIVREVEQMLKTRDLIVPKHLVGVDPHVLEIMANLNFDYRNGQAVRIGNTREKVLIYGIPGVGKTVLAKCVYNQLQHLHDGCSFLEKIQEEIRDHGIVSVQNRLISHLHNTCPQQFDCPDRALIHLQRRFRNMKVLVLLDDVEDHEQLSKLVGELDWLGPGSTVIVTSRRKNVLQKVSGAKSFVLRTMKQDDALTLFCKHAFKTDDRLEKFRQLATGIVATTDGLPLALQKVGESLFDQSSETVWKEKLTALQKAPDKSVQAALEKSYDTLEENEKQIFLDIACFFNGKDKRIPRYMWDARIYSPSISIRTLHVKSLVEISEDKKLSMHGILKTFGQEIVKNEIKKEPCKRSRLCNHKEALDVLIRGKDTVYVEALGMDRFDGPQDLKFLKLDQADTRGNFGDQSSSLRWLDWQRCPEIFDNHIILAWQNLVILDFFRSQVHKDWSGWKLLVEARKLKVLKLTGCVQLTATPEFPPSMELERLILEGCSRLEVINPSVRNLTKLVSLNMKGCGLLRELPDLGPMINLKELVIDGTSISQINVQEGSMRELKTLSARNCEKLTEISDSIRYLKSLTYLALDGSEINTLQESVGLLKKLKTLSLKHCRKLSSLPDGIGRLRSLQYLDLSHTVIQELPPSVKDLKAMKVLRMRGTFIREFPEAILNLEKLEEIDFSLCGSLEGRIPDDIGRLKSLAILKPSDTRISGLPASISHLFRSWDLDVSRCDDLQSVSKLPCSVNFFCDLGN